jgi:small subunit ribosomal protein S21e
MTSLILIIFNMQNEEGKVVDLYIPRKCSATKRLLPHYDHASVQFYIPSVSKDGLVVKSDMPTYCISGKLRMNGKADTEINKLLCAKKVMVC